MRALVFALALAALAGCKNPRYCAGNPDNDCDQMWDAADGDAAGTCSSNAQCSPPTGVCDLADHACVACLAPDQTSACSGATPTCGSDDQCHACAAHSDCASAACLPDGSCGSDSNVAYVDAAGTANAMCTKAMPCTTVASALATSRPYIKVHGTIDEQVSIVSQNVTLLADPAAALTSTTNGTVLQISGTSDVAIYDLMITGASGTGNPGISMPTGTGTLSITRGTISTNNGGGIVANGGTLVVKQSQIVGNTGGGMSLTGTRFDIENNFIATNGGLTTSFGGVSLAQITNTTNTFAFNTVTSNGGASGAITGVVCSLVSMTNTFADNIIYANQVSGGGTQVGGTNCSYTYSDVGPDTVAGTGNINMDPSFVDAVHGNYHLNTSSPCKDTADPSATIHVDIDGDSRPQGAGFDMGADEIKQ